MGFFGQSGKPLPPSGKPPAQAPSRPSLEAVYNGLLAKQGSVDTNTLTNQLVTAVIEYSVHEGASDVHFDPHGEVVNVRFRIDGDLRGNRLTFAQKVFPVTAQIRVMAGFSPKAATAHTPEDGAFELPIDERSVRFRVSAFPTIHGDKLVVRLLDMGKSTQGLEQLGFTLNDLKALKSAVSSPSGIFFVCGITGGGKTTTLSSILKYLNRPEINIMTLEDPVEYQLPNTIQSSINAKAGFNFADGLRCILRQDPDIIMVGEIRDKATAEIAMRAALTGHLIFSTIHTISTTGVISRLIDMGMETFLITETMIGTLAQRLVKMVCPQCKVAVKPQEEVVEGIVKGLPPQDTQTIMSMVMAPGANFLEGKGCPACNNTGRKGRTGIFELLVLSKPLRDLISTNPTMSELRKAAVGAGMKTLLMDGIVKARAGMIPLHEIAKISEF